MGEHGAAAVEVVAEGLWVVRMPLPMRVEPVNCYVGEADDGRLVIVDTGLDLAAAELWSDAFGVIGRALTDVDEIFITHFHPDHIGASLTLHELSGGARVTATAITVEQTPGVWGSGLMAYFDAMEQHLVAHGMPLARVREIPESPELAQLAVRIPAEVEVRGVGATMRMAGADWELIATPGHADGHASLWDASGSTLMAGDHLLERISPAVGRFPHHHGNPLSSYIDSLRQVAQLEPQLVLPGHGRSFEGGAARAEALVRHHEARRLACVAASDGERTAWDISREVFGHYDDAASERFATTETLAHLELARSMGEVGAAELDGRTNWHAVGPGPGSDAPGVARVGPVG